MITADLHAHTSFSSDSEEPMENALSAMVEKGLKTVCFTEHMDMDYPGGEFLLDAAAYRSRLVELREEFRGRIEVLFGVELGLMDYLAPRLREYVGAPRTWSAALTPTIRSTSRNTATTTAFCAISRAYWRISGRLTASTFTGTWITS